VTHNLASGTNALASEHNFSRRRLFYSFMTRIVSA
jgi:hypothetical protein